MNDLTYRQAAIDGFYEMASDMDHLCTVSDYVSFLESLPSAQPERKKGKWNFEEYPDGYYHSECSVCGSWFKEDAFLNPYNFCPNCGADMRERRPDETDY